MALIDWCIVLGLIVGLFLLALIANRYNKSVAGFLAADRCAGRYLLAISEGIAGLGAITLIAEFQTYYNSGFTAAWWNLMPLVVSTFALLSGWVFYRYRQSRVLTVGQLFETRYSRGFRIFSGMICCLSGIINFGIFPSVGARFIILFCGLPYTTAVYAIVMASLIMIALTFTFLGGQIAVIVTDFAQGVFCSIVFVVISAILLVKFDWSQITQVLISESSLETRKSLIDPFGAQSGQDFGFLYFAVFSFTIFYIQGVWQGSGGYNVSALNAHEARMGKAFSVWRAVPMTLFVILISVCSFTVMHHPDFAQKAAVVKTALSQISNPSIQTQMTTIIASKTILPVGITGALVAVMLAAFISTHDTYLHSWGSMIIQDVLYPCRKKELTPKQHIRFLRVSIFGVGVFIFIFSLIFRQTQYIRMFFMITGAIYFGGGGAVLIGALYWKKGTTTGAYVAMITGAVLSVGGIILDQFHTSSPFSNSLLKYIAELNGAYQSFWASMLAILAYIITSLLTYKENFDLDKMLHRGQYKVEEQQRQDSLRHLKKGGIKKVLGINSDFTRKDVFSYLLTMMWTVVLVLLFIGGLIYRSMADLGLDDWSKFWFWYIIVFFIVSVFATIWFLFGGINDLRRMFKLLSTARPDDTDNGRVEKVEA